MIGQRIFKILFTPKNRIIHNVVCSHIYNIPEWRLCLRKISTNVTVALNGYLNDIFKLRNTTISNWIIENKVHKLCCEYYDSTKEERQLLLTTLACQYGISHNDVIQISKKLINIQEFDDRQLFNYEQNLKNSLIPAYQWLFMIMGRLDFGVKFLVDLRTDILELLPEIKDTDKHFRIQQLNVTLRDLLLMWFSVGFLDLERITWQSPCDTLQKVSDYEAIHPIKNWLDLKRRVGPYRRCYIFTHQSMPREPLVVLHTALCDDVPESVRGIEEAQIRILGEEKRNITFLEEDKSKIKAAVFYSISSTQKGLQGIELGNYLIKEVVREITNEFPMIDLFSTLSPIPDFRLWLLSRAKEDIQQIFTKEECNIMKNLFNSNDILLKLIKTFKTSMWIHDDKLAQFFKKPLLRMCAWYLYKEKRRNYALNKVANFHLRNGAVMWRINWLADSSPRGIANSCGIMVNYRYFLDECEINSRKYIENYHINASQSVIEMAEQGSVLQKKCKSS